MDAAQSISYERLQKKYCSSKRQIRTCCGRMRVDIYAAKMMDCERAHKKGYCWVLKLKKKCFFSAGVRTTLIWKNDKYFPSSRRYCRYGTIRLERGTQKKVLTFWCNGFFEDNGAFIEDSGAWLLMAGRASRQVILIVINSGWGTIKTVNGNNQTRLNPS